MTLRECLSFESIDELTAYLGELYNTLIEKIDSGSKRLMFALPPGAGKTTTLLRLAKRYAQDNGKRVLFIAYNRAEIEYYTHELSDALPNVRFITLFHLTQNDFKDIGESDVVLVDSLGIMERRQLMGRLKAYSGVVVSSFDPSQDIVGGR